MTAQAALIADTIAGMKRAIARYQDSSDSDEPYLQPSNRGNKLKRKSHYIQDGQAGRANGPKIYKRSIKHAGFHRNILQRNPKRYDEDGDELEDNDLDEEADARAAEENPYAEIRLEDLLLPLVSAASLPNHPSLSVAYTSPTLTNMAQHACEMMHKERKTLARAERLMTKLRGDETWLPCGLLYSERDEAMFNTEKLYANVHPNGLSRSPNEFVAQEAATVSVKGDAEPASCKSSTSATELGSDNDTTKGTHQELATVVGVGEKAITNGGVLLEAVRHEDLKEMVNRRVQEEHDVELAESNVPQNAGSEETTKHQEADLDDEMVDIVGSEISATGEHQSETAMQRKIETSHINGETANGEASADPAQGGTRIEDNPASLRGTEIAPTNHLPTPEMEEVGDGQGIEGVEGEDQAQPVPRRMRTRAQAQAASEPTASSRNESPESWVPPDIHPLFMIPEKAMPDKDFGLPADEAAETRRMLTMYVQKQEEVCRGAEKLYEGLLKADRQRNMVLEWCKAEGHVGEMSDGEDWYDKEEWGLEEDLKKGHNDEDEDNAVPGKKTRGRRA